MEEKTQQHLRRISRVRHEATNYDKLAVFYRRAFPELRSKLNKLCSKVLLGKIEFDDFFAEVEKLEELVNLNFRKNRKRWFVKEIERIKNTWGVPITINNAKKIAKQNLSEILRAQSTYCGNVR